MNFDTSESEEDVVQPMPSRNGRGRRRDDAADVGNSVALAQVYVELVVIVLICHLR